MADSILKQEIDLPKILLVTKSQELQQELRKILDSYLLLVCEDYESALRKINLHSDICAILVGIYLPETKGFELLDYFKENPDFYKGPVLAVTDSISDAVIEKVKNYDIFDFIVRYSNSLIIKTRIRNAVIYFSEKRKLLEYAVDQVCQNLNDTKMLVSLLAQVVEFKNSESGKHIEQVGTITRILCKKLAERYPDKYKDILTDGNIEYITLASALHDIGKVYIPDYILNKPGKLDDQERLIMQTHAALGAGIINRMHQFKERPVIKYAYDICLCHHERWDGNGYPNKLVGDQIPIWAQIVSVADCYDALTSDRIYREALLPAGALSLISSGQCGEFNPEVLECFWESIEEIEANKTAGISLKYTKESLYTIVEDICKIK